MTPEDQRMIQDLFQRLAAQGRVTKDPQAERVISDGLRSNPDAAYMLVQTALVYEYQMNEQEVRIRDLEDQIAQMQRSSSAPAAGGSFLGNRVGGGRAGSVPNVQAASPWQQPQSPSYQQAAQQPAPQRGGMFGGAPAAMAPQAGAAPAAGGGFLRSALTTAAGVAGGMMVANSLSGMFGGGNNAHAAGHNTNDQALRDADHTQDEMQDRIDELEQQQEPEQDVASDASDVGGWDGVET
jgi:uncharacterized protein